MEVKAPKRADATEDIAMQNFGREKIDKPKSLFRYHDKSNETALVEKIVADYVGAKYCVAVNSCSSAMFLALQTCKIKDAVKIGFPVFTFTAVPSAIVHAGGIPVPLKCTRNYYLDVDDLEDNAKDGRLNMLLLSYMRGHYPDVRAVMDICGKYGIIVIEDCAHALGVKYRGRFLGTFGAVGCYSSQSAKIINSGEGGFLVTDDADIAAKAIIMAGSYERLWQNHIVRPGDEIMLKHQNWWPCYGLRMHNLTASLLIRQLSIIEDTISHVNDNYEKLAAMLGIYDDKIRIACFLPHSRPVLDTMQFELSDTDVPKFSQKTGIDYFGSPDNARAYWNWGYLSMPKGMFPDIDDLLPRTVDLRLPARYTDDDIVRIFDKIGRVLDE